MRTGQHLVRSFLMPKEGGASPVDTKASSRCKAADSEQSQESSIGPAQSTTDPSALLGRFRMCRSSSGTPPQRLMASSEAGTGRDVGVGRGPAGFSSFSHALHARHRIKVGQ